MEWTIRFEWYGIENNFKKTQILLQIRTLQWFQYKIKQQTYFKFEFKKTSFLNFKLFIIERRKLNHMFITVLSFLCFVPTLSVFIYDLSWKMHCEIQMFLRNETYDWNKQNINFINSNYYSKCQKLKQKWKQFLTLPTKLL